MNPWELGDDDSVFHEPSKEKIREHKQKEFNTKQKALAKLIGENLAAYSCVLIVVLMITLIWTDIGISINFTKFIVESIVSVALFIVGEYLTSKIGATGGRLDNLYVKVHTAYISLRERVVSAGITLMPKFCDQQIDEEYERYIRRKCKEYKLDYDEYINKYSKMSLDQLQKTLKKKSAIAIAALNQTRRIELTPGMLLTDGKVRGEREGIPVSGEEYIETHTTGALHIILAAVVGLLTAFPAFTPTADASIGRVAYTCFKMAMLLFRMYIGYARGAKAFNTIEPIHLQAKIRYLNMYLEFLKKEGEGYGTETDGSEQTDPQGCRDSESGGVLHHGSAESI